MKRLSFFTYFILAFWVLLVAIPAVLNWQSFCYNAYDLGIYAQALAKITWTDLNPWISVRQIRIFNDHFDPILILLAPLANFSDPSLVTIFIELAFAPDESAHDECATQYSRHHR